MGNSDISKGSTMNYLLLLGLFGSLVLSENQSYDCPSGKSSSTFDITASSGVAFKTQEGDEYGKKAQCKIKFNLDSSCEEMELNCDGFDMAKGSQMTVKVGKNKAKKFKKKFSTVTATEDVLVTFKSKTKVASGASCSMSCTVSATGGGSGSEIPSGGTGGRGGGTVPGYTQAWLRGEGPEAHVHEGIRRADGSGWVAIGDTLPEENKPLETQVLVRYVDNEANTQWSRLLGSGASGTFNVGFSVIEGNNVLYAGVGLWQSSSNQQAPAVVALDPSTGEVLWTKVLGEGKSGHGGVRSCIMDNTDIVCVGFFEYSSYGFVFVADESKPVIWRLDSNGNLLTENIVSVDGMGQLAKIRKDATSGFIACSTAWGEIGGNEVNVVALVKFKDNLSTDWSQTYGLAGGNSQVFDMLVDNDGNYLLGGHTTVGDGVVNWDYLALKVDSQTKQQLWRKAYGQPRGFDPNYIHDEMYGVALDNSGNYLLLGGSGDEYPYSAMGTGQWSGWSSDEWGSYLVVVSPSGEKLYENFYGSKGGNNAGEWLTYNKDTGDIMIYADSDTVGGFGFLKLTPNA